MTKMMMMMMILSSSSSSSSLSNKDEDDTLDRVVQSPTELIRCPKLSSSPLTTLIRKFERFYF